MPHETSQEGRTPGDLLQYPRWNERQIKISWHKDWYDGPIDGIIVYQGERYWFSFYCDTDEPGNPFYYLVYPLSLEEADSSDVWAEISDGFAKRWQPLANDPATANSPELESIGLEWERHRATLPDFTKRGAVAWFASGSNSSFYGVEITPA